MANKKDYQAGFDRAMEAIRTTLVNGIGEFKKMPIFIHSIVGIVETPINSDPKVFYEGVVDACTQEWDKAKVAEIADIEAEKREVAADYERMLMEKKTA